MRFFPLILIFLALNACAVKKYTGTTSQPVSHKTWDKLLKAHVNDEGWVDYQGFIRDSAQLNSYLDLLSRNHPNDANWSREEQLAYWINAYNAFTIKLVADHYPVESIKDIKKGIPFVNTVWDIKFIRIEGATYDLNNIEHGIIRPTFKDYRVHFALNCASRSCPKLLNEAYTAEKLDRQLDDAARTFLADPEKNKISENKVEVSKILDWYWGDFKDKFDSVPDFINAYSSVKVSKKAEVSYLEYDWGLNEVRK
ncbi:MAG: DUF547 domain-containing protein [Lewinellaceae bacterium]|nr:DUF547 domain-containing protein [Lewinella sp.]MCB9277628.1 DUF547 domain-containing protein [Lewinellaceae bacterium]